MTTDRATLLALAHRVEAASGPDRALSADILKAVGYTTHAWRVFDPNGKPCQQVPDVLASIDAALSLVRRAKCFLATMGDLAGDGLPGCCLCVSTDPVQEVWGVSFGGGSDPDERLARATTAAVLRALAQEAPIDER